MGLALPSKYAHSLEIVNVETTATGFLYVYVNLLNSLAPGERGSLLLDLEDDLVKQDPRARVWHLPLGDKNSLRSLRGVSFN